MHWADVTTFFFFLVIRAQNVQKMLPTLNKGVTQLWIDGK